MTAPSFERKEALRGLAQMVGVPLRKASASGRRQ